METGLRHLHSTIAVLVILGLLITIVLALVNKPVNSTTRKAAKISMILVHTQFLVGLIFYFVSSRGFETLMSGSAMSDPTARLYAVEHPLVGILTVVAITIGHAKLKRAGDAEANKPILIFYIIGLLLVLSRIPWSTWSLLN